MLDSTPDRDLMLRFCRTQDRRAFESLVRRWDRPVLSFLAKASGDYQGAQDMRQEVFLRVYRYGETYKPEHAFPTWLFRIACNVLSTSRKKAARWPELSGGNSEASERMVDPAPGPREHAERGELGADIEAMLGRLSEDERALILLRLGLEFNYREMGEMLGAPETTVKSRFYAALTRLRSTLDEQPIIERSYFK